MIIKEHVILALDEDLKKKRQELIELIKECDVVKSEIADQRRWKNDVYTQQVSISSELYTLESILQETQKIMERNRENFHKLTDKQREKINEFNEKIAESMEILAEYEGKELIDIDSENRKRKISISKKSKELQEIKDDIQSLKNERIEFEKEKEETRRKLDEEHQRYIDYMDNLVIRERDVEILEKRFSKIN